MKPRRVLEKIAMRIGINLFSRSKHDRFVLEKVVFPFLLSKDNCQRILFVGCEYYTRPYNRLFRGRDFWTIDFSPKHAKYGAKNHIVDGIENLERHFSPDRFDAIICNGVFGWGLNERPAVDAAFGACYRCLAPDGLFILGWDDHPRWRPFHPTEAHAISQFRPYVFGPLGTAEFLTRTPYRHTFNFFIKPATEHNLDRHSLSPLTSG